LRCFESGSETKYQRSTMQGQSSCPKDEALRTVQAGRGRDRAPAQNNKKAKPEQLKLNKTCQRWATTTDSYIARHKGWLYNYAQARTI
jgi:hypothetical protein